MPCPNFNSDSISWILGLSNEVSFVSRFSLKGGQNSQNIWLKILLYVYTCRSVYIRKNRVSGKILDPIQTVYSSVLNNRAANLILFWKKSILHALIPSCTFINFWIFLAKTFFYTNEKWKSPSCTALFHPARLLTFGILPSCTFIPSCTIIKDTRVLTYSFYWSHDFIQLSHFQ